MGYVNDGLIQINEKQWEELNKKHSKEEVKEILSDLIDTNKLDLPVKQINKNDAILSFEKMKNGCSEIKQGKWFSRYEYKYKLSDYYFDIDSVGNLSSDYFFQSERMKCDSINAPSPHRSWYIKRFRMSLFNAFWTLKFKQINSKNIMSAIALRKYIAAQFRPATAKALYQHFEARNVLDFCSGWGDRLSGFMASDAISYTGVDPNKNLIDPYKNIINEFNQNKSIKMINGCAEDVKYEEKYDFIFTSPPYFNIEKYSKCENQSCIKHKGLDNWLNDFLFKAISNAWDALEINGVMAINISDVYSGHKINKICDLMNDFISDLKGAKYFGCYGYRMAKRPNSKSQKEGVFCEPIWIWQKTIV